MSRLDRECSFDGCSTHVWARELCRKHYMRWHQHGDPSIVLVKQTPAGAPAAFLEALPATGDGCVRWPFSTNNMGYAQINRGDGKRLVTRIVCERHHGAPPSPRHEAAHSCGRGHEACVAPWHLSWKTHAGNCADMDGHGTRLRGEAAPWAKLTEERVREIRSFRGKVSQGALAARYGVTQSMISQIRRGKAWAHVEVDAQ